MTYPSIPITISWLWQLHYYYFWLAKHLIWFPRIRYDKPLTIIGIFTNMAVFPTGTTWNHLEPPGTTRNQLEPVGTTWIQLKFGWTWFQWNQLEIHFRLESRWKFWRVFPAYLAGTLLRKFQSESTWFQLVPVRTCGTQ